ncbi:MAG: ACP S-malonyltransferase [Fidelibacterota bacterium]
MSKLAFIFPGQASQHVGMGYDLYCNYEIAREMYDRASRILNYDIAKISFEGPMEQLTQTRVTQPAILIHSLIITDILKNLKIQPHMVAGHSLGEYSALACAEAFSFENALELVKIRAEEMQRAGEENPGTMAAIIGLDPEKVEEVCIEVQDIGVATIANYNCPGQIAISGSVDAVRKAMEISKEKGARRAIQLEVSGAFHSPLMSTARQTLTEALNGVEIKSPKYPIYTNVTADPTTDPEEIRLLLIRQLESPVLWTQSIQNMIKDGAHTFLEVGPGKVLQGLVRRTDKSIHAAGIEKIEDIESFLETNTV